MNETSLSTTEAAKRAGVSVVTIHNWVDAGHIVAEEEWQGGKRVRHIDSASLETYLAALAERKERNSKLP